MPFYLAVLQPDDTDELFRDKCRRVAAYLDFVYVRLMVNNKLGKSEQMFAELLPLLEDLQTCPDLDALEKLLGHRVAVFEYDFTAVKQYGLRPDNRAQVRYLLARLTAFVEVEAGRPNEMSRYLDLAEPFEIEHVWANRFERHQAEVKTQDNFRIQRNRLGALLLLQKSHNASYQDQPFEKKVEWYRGQNQLAASLHPVTHDRNRPFTEDVVKAYNLQKLLRAFNHFDLTAIEVRQQLYERLCEIIWDPKELGFRMPPQPTAPDAVAAKAVSKRTRAHFGGVTVARLVDIGVLSSGDDLSLTYRRESHSAQINEQGRIELKTGEQFDSPSPAGATVTGKSINGWTAWKLRKDGKLTALHDIRKDALARGLLDS